MIGKGEVWIGHGSFCSHSANGQPLNFSGLHMFIRETGVELLFHGPMAEWVFVSDFYIVFDSIDSALPESRPEVSFNRYLILLMEEILHHLGCIKLQKEWDKLPINWCRISSINSSTFKTVFF